MRTTLIVTAAAMTMIGGFGQAEAQAHLNPVVDLLAKNKPAFGLYAPANRGGGRRGAPPPADAPKPKTMGELAQEAVAFKNADYIFDGTMERNFDTTYPRFAEFAKGMSEAGILDKSSKKQTHPLFVKMHEIGTDFAVANDHIGKQLNLGVAGVVLVGVESPDEVKAGLAAMRFKSKGGTRPDDVGGAPAFWGLSEKEYKDKADVWPLNPNGELVNFTIVESKAGLAKLDEIAAVKGIGVLFPGAGTLRGVFTDTTGGERKFNAEAWEASIQQVLTACKKYKVACGYPANTATEMEARMKQGFSVFISGWGDAGFQAVEAGKKVGGR